MTRPVVAVDVDCVVADFIGPVVDRINEVLHLGEPVHAVDDVTAYNMYAALEVPEWAQQMVNATIAAPGFCASLQLYPDAPWFVASLREVADVIAVTAPWDSDTWMRERERWLGEKLGFKRSEVVFTDKKHLLDVDAIVEDVHSTIVQFAAARRGLPVLLDQPWNREDIPRNARRAMNLKHAELLIRDHLLRGATQREEAGWLVERNVPNTGPGAVWWTGTCWSADSWEALRFAREQDAIMYITSGNFASHIRATEHRWIS